MGLVRLALQDNLMRLGAWAPPDVIHTQAAEIVDLLDDYGWLRAESLYRGARQHG